MPSTLKMTARDFDLSAPIETEIRERAAKLERFDNSIVDCETAIEAPVGHHRKGGPYKL